MYKLIIFVYIVVYLQLNEWIQSQTVLSRTSREKYTEKLSLRL